MIGSVAKYSLEIARSKRALSESLRADTEESPESSELLSRFRPTATSAMGALGVVFYDIAAPDGGDPDAREQVRTLSSRLLLLTDLVDDILDQRNTSPAEKEEFLRLVESDLFGHTRSMSHDPEEEASFVLAHSLWKDLEKLGAGESMEGSFDRWLTLLLSSLQRTILNGYFGSRKLLGVTVLLPLRT